MSCKFDFVAQLVEHLTFNEGVPGSSPGGVTTLPNGVTTGKNSIGPRRAWRHTVIVVLGVSVKYVWMAEWFRFSSAK
jgi:hypothetical protein